MTWIGDMRARRYRREIDQRQDLYNCGMSDDSVHLMQVYRLNREWARMVATSPYMARLQRERSLPGKFESLEQFVALVPTISRTDVQANLAEMQCRGPKPDFFRITGGSTAQPVQLPAWNSELQRTRPDVWVGRGWYGITPSSTLFLLWGHSHLLGTGGAGWVRGKLREFYDRLLGYQRFSAYDLRPEKMRLAADALERNPPEYVIGYSVALDLFARVNADRADRLRALGIKVVIATAESFPSEQSAARLEALFGCPVAMEYGAVETGLLAHAHPSGGFKVFWRSYMVDAEPTDHGHQLFVTSLYPRCFPLVRYSMGDSTRLTTDTTGPVAGIRRLAEVIGRSNDYITLTSGALVHSELFTHAVRMCSDIHAYQVVQSPSRIYIRYVSSQPLADTTLESIRDRLGVIHPSLRSIAIERVEQLEQTVAGKTRMVVSE